MSGLAQSGLKPLQQNNSQSPGILAHKMTVKKPLVGSKVTARADSTGLENDKAMIIKHHHSVKKMQTTSVVRRNARERNRVKGVNDGFGVLKVTVPHLKNKSSKVETLRGAIDYIKRMRSLLGHPDIEDDPLFKMEFGDEHGDDDDESSTFSDLTADASPETSPETSLREICPMVYALPPASSPYQPRLLHSLLPSPTLPSPTLSIPSPSLAPLLPCSPKPLSSPTEPALEKLPSISTTMWWPLNK